MDYPMLGLLAGSLGIGAWQFLQAQKLRQRLANAHAKYHYKEELAQKNLAELLQRETGTGTVNELITKWQQLNYELGHTHQQAEEVEPTPVLKKQQRAQQQIQPSASPAHDQARQAFITASSSVTQALQENGAGLQAAYLQQVSKSLVKQPEIKEIDQENLAKVFTSIDQLPGLKNSPDVSQLKQAVQVLNKPVKQAQTQQQQPELQRGPRLS